MDFFLIATIVLFFAVAIGMLLASSYICGGDTVKRTYFRVEYDLDDPDGLEKAKKTTLELINEFKKR